MVATTTPKFVTKNIRDLCARMRVTSEPVFIPVRSRQGSALGDCFNDVKRHVAEFGGSLVHGWILWEWPGVLIEAEFHGVWRSPNNELIDVSLRSEGEKVILFVADPTRTFDGARVDNVRHAIGKSPTIRTFIQNQNRFFKLYKETHGDRTGEVTLEGELAELYDQQQALAKQLATSDEALAAWKRFAAGHPYISLVRGA